MHKHILLPVDGSDFGMGVIPYAMALARSTRARLTAITVTMPYNAILAGPLAARISEDEYSAHTAEVATGTLRKVQDAAAAADVSIKAYHVQHRHPWEAIIQVAGEEGCDLILMASHGRRGIAGLLLGSETKKVLTHTSIPVLVWRA